MGLGGGVHSDAAVAAMEVDLLGAQPEGLGVGCACASRPVLLGASWAQGS